MTLARTILLTATLLALPAVCSAKSAKRGAGWDEHTTKLNTRHAELLKPGVSWVYNWGPDAANSNVFDADLRFEPMAWNGAFNENRIRTWLTAHPECQYLLAFNEPNFADQARMTPAEAAAKWPALEKIAADFGVKLVAPALNFSNSQVGGRVWNPYEWYDEFFRLVPEAKVECLAMHCYMNWYSAQTWLATEYFYSDLYNTRKDCYGKYPNLVKFLDNFKAARGHFPRMMLTEFCSWENDGTIKNVDFQIDQMTQKVQKLEQSDLVEGYAWFMANAANGAAAFPYMSLFERNTADSDLSTLGKVYVNMSTFDTDRYYAPGEVIQAKDYVEATTDDRVIRVRPNTEAASELPLQIEIPAGGYPDYQIDVPVGERYSFVFHASAPSATTLVLYIDNKKYDSVNVAGDWDDVKIDASLTQGKHRIMLYNGGASAMLMNRLSFITNAGVDDIMADNTADVVEVFDLVGRSLGCPDRNTLSPGVYVLRYDNGTSEKIRI